MVIVFCPTYLARQTVGSVRKDRYALVNSIELCLKIRASLRNSLKVLKLGGRLVMAAPIADSMKAGINRTVLGSFSGCCTAENSYAASNGKMQSSSREMVSRNIFFFF